LIYLIELKVLFECDIPDGHWSQTVVDFDIKDRMVSFKTPTFPYLFDKTKAVDVILRQDNRIIDTIKYFYLATSKLKNILIRFFLQIQY
jgi:hypothetical protein